MTRRIIKYLPWVLLAIVMGLYIGHALYYGGWVNDDAGITFTYAKNLADGHGLVLNPGGERVEAYSNPLWVFILSFFHLIGLFDPVITTKVLLIVFTLGSLFLVVKLSRELFGSKSSLLHLLAPLLLSANVSFVVWSVSGLESGFYVFLILLALYLYLREMQDTSRVTLSGLVFFMIAITRPEGMIYFGVALVHKLFIVVSNSKITKKDLFWVLSFALPFLAYHIWHYNYFAYLFPNTYYAKGASGNVFSKLRSLMFELKGGWGYVIGAVRDYNLAIVLTSVSFFVAIYFKKRFTSIVLVFLFIGASVFYPIYVGSDWMMQYRIMFPFYPLAYLLVTGGVLALTKSYLSGLSGNSQAKKASRLIAVFVTIGVLFFLIYPNLSFAEKAKNHPTVPFSNVARHGEKFRDWAEKASLENPTWLQPDIGGASYKTDIQIIDLAKLADVHLAHWNYREDFFRDYIFEERKPTFVHTHCIWSHRSNVNEYPEFRRDYIPIQENECHILDLPGDEIILNGDYVRKDAFVKENPDIENKLNSSLDKGISLAGYNIAANVARSGSQTDITLFWKSTGKVPDGVKYNYALELKRDDQSGNYRFNLFGNSSMETETDNSSGGTRSGQTSRSGDYSWKSTKRWDGPQESVGFDLSKGEKYTVSAWVKNTGDNEVTVRALSSDSKKGSTYGVSLGAIEPNGDWERLSTTVTGDRYFKSLRIRLEIDRDVKNGAVYFDDIQAERGNILTPRNPSANLYSFVFGWYPPERWIKGETIEEKRLIPIPGEMEPGEYDLALKLIKDGRVEKVTNLGEMKIGERWVNQRLEELWREYKRQVGEGDYEKSLLILNEALELAENDKRFQKEKKVVVDKLIENSVTRSRKKIEQKEYREALGILLNVRGLKKSDDRTSKLLSRLSKIYYQRGKNFQDNGEWDRAFRSFQLSLRANRSNAWARRKLESVRPRTTKIIDWFEGKVEVDLSQLGSFDFFSKKGETGIRLEEGESLAVPPFRLDPGTYEVHVLSNSRESSSFSGQNSLGFSISTFSEIFENSSFEKGNLSNWIPKGKAFKNQPTFSDNSAGRGKPSGMEGDYYIGTYEDRPNPSSSYGVRGDKPTGVLTSKSFIIEKDRLSFLLGGGAKTELRVELMVNGEVKKSASPADNRERMKRVVWDLSGLRGSEARIRLVDNSGAEWGHINFDSLAWVSNRKYSVSGDNLPVLEIESPEKIMFSIVNKNSKDVLIKKLELIPG